jgi:hypothetical protein
MGDYAEHVTTGLLYGSHYLKDNRLLPRGFAKANAPREVAVQGAAADDADFIGGSDSVAYSVPLSNAGGPLNVTAELLFQSIGYRWAQNLRTYDAPEPQRFVRLYEQHANESSTLLSRAAVTAN